MKRLIHTNRTPHGGGYAIDRPDVGVVASGSTFKQLENAAKVYRKANGIPTGLGFSIELEQLVCEQYPDECNNTDPNALKRPHRLRLGDVLLGTKVMMGFVAAGKPIVDMAEATRRASICLNCPQHVQFSKPCGGACGELRSVVKSLVGNQSVPRASELGACFICHCFLESAVWMRLDVQVKPLSDAQKAQFEQVDNCWKKASLLEKLS